MLKKNCIVIFLFFIVVFLFSFIIGENDEI